MRKLILLAAAVLLTSLIAVSSADNDSARAQIGPPTRISGTVLVDGSIPPIGTEIRARIDGHLCGQTTVREVEDIGIGYVIDVLWIGHELNCGTTGKVILFEVETIQGEFLGCLPSAVGTGAFKN